MSRSNCNTEKKWGKNTVSKLNVRYKSIYYNNTHTYTEREGEGERMRPTRTEGVGRGKRVRYMFSLFKLLDLSSNIDDCIARREAAIAAPAATTTIAAAHMNVVHCIEPYVVHPPNIYVKLYLFIRF